MGTKGHILCGGGSVPLPDGALIIAQIFVRESRAGLASRHRDSHFFGCGSGRVASPAQRERPPTEGRRVRVRAHGTPVPCLKPCLPSPGALRAPASPRFAGRGNMAYGRELRG
jgi:hypothetical protein